MTNPTQVRLLDSRTLVIDRSHIESADGIRLFHTPGHCSMLVELEGSRPLLFMEAFKAYALTPDPFTGTRALTAAGGAG